MYSIAAAHTAGEAEGGVFLEHCFELVILRQRYQLTSAVLGTGVLPQVQGREDSL